MDLGLLFLAICLVESGCNPNVKPGDNGEAVGIAQIRPIMVRECNRILDIRKYRWPKFTLGDRKNVVQSYRMFVVYTRYWNECHEVWDRKTTSTEDAARRWNGGPHGHEKDATVAYGRKVMKELKALTNKE